MMIRTRRLLLRPTFPEDWREVYRGIADWDVVRMLARAPWPYRPEDAQTYCAQAGDVRALRFAIMLPGAPGCPMVGQIGIHEGPDGADHELGYWIAREHWGQGYATEAAEAALDAAAVLGIAEVESGHFVDNPASGAVLVKCGFVERGGLREMTSAGRGGAVLAKRYTCDLAQRPIMRLAA